MNLSNMNLTSFDCTKFTFWGCVEGGGPCVLECVMM